MSTNPGLCTFKGKKKKRWCVCLQQFFSLTSRKRACRLLSLVLLHGLSTDSLCLGARSVVLVSLFSRESSHSFPTLAHSLLGCEGLAPLRCPHPSYWSRVLVLAILVSNSLYRVAFSLTQVIVLLFNFISSLVLGGGTRYILLLCCHLGALNLD